MTTFSTSPAGIFNRIRCKLKKRGEIAGQIAKRTAVVAQEKAEAQELSDLIRKDQEDVSHDRAVMRNDVELMAMILVSEQAEIDKKEDKVTRERALLAQEKTVIRRNEDKLAKLYAIEAHLLEDVTDLFDQLDEDGARKPLLLEFPDDKTLLWGKNGRVTLPRIQYTIIKTLYHTKRHRMPIGKLEDKVWGVTMPTVNNARVALRTLNKALEEANCPYRVRRVQLPAITNEVEHPRTKKIETHILRPEIEVYKLIYQDF